jgi:two-component system cell cycle sensor histidine kinase/response regulator CckA
MAHLLDTDGRKARQFDPLVVAAGIFFLLAASFTTYLAMRAGPAAMGGLLLIAGVAGVAIFAMLAMRGANARQADAGGMAALLAALPEAAAVASSDGRVIEANAAWDDVVGLGARLPKSSRSGGLFTALSAAAKGQLGATALRIANSEREVQITRLGERRFLVRLAAAAQEPAVVAVQPPAQVAPQSAAVSGLDAFAAAAPFGAALLSGSDPLGATILEINPAIRALTGGVDPTGATLASLIEPGSLTEAASRIAAGRSGPVEIRLAHDTHRIAHLYLTRNGDGFVAYLVDVSEQKQMELALSQSEKMRAIGQLAGGVAHDFNNLLTAIQLRLDELLLRHSVGDPSHEGLMEIRQTSIRAADLVRKLLTHARKQTVQRQTLELGELISEIEVLLRRVLREDVKLETEYGRNLPLVRADKSELETAVMNLAVNARDAVRAQGGGIVHIRTARLTQAEARALGYDDDRGGGGDIAMIEVYDNGPGIPPDVMKNIFVPFFTTKAVGEGTGLGLATVYGVVKQADGWIHVESPPGKGATFRIFLPVHIPAEVTEPAPAAAAAPHRPPARDLSGAGRILFVEDEDAVRTVAARLLRARGYEVIEAADGEEALILAEEHAGQIDLLISDVIMPGIDGPTLLKKARGFLGSAPVMFISGYAEAEFSDLLEDEKGVTFLPKPIDIKTLAERVKQQLAA